MADLTVDELVAMIRHSGSPIVLIEGRDDVVVYRRLEEIFLEEGVTVQPAGGRNKVLEVYRRKQEFSQGVGTTFIVDRDIWVMVGIPEEFAGDDLIKTDGYSIENDIFSTGELERLMSAAEDTRFRIELQTFIRWYAYAVDRKCKGEDCTISDHPNVVLDNADFKAAIAPVLGGADYPEARYAEILDSYRTLLRGKSLMALLVRQLRAPGRVPQHHPVALMETASVVGSPYMQQLTAKVAAQLAL